MATCVRSYSKINLGLAIGAPRADGFHSLSTLYQTLALHDLVTVAAKPAAETRIALRSNDPRVPTDARNTAWKMVERALERLGRTAEVTVHIQKNLPIQGGMGAGSANAAAALLGLERELRGTGGRNMLSNEERLAVAAEVGSDVPLFLIGGAVLGSDRGQSVREAPAVTLGGLNQIPCVIALPAVGVSTPQAFRDWDKRLAGGPTAKAPGPDLHNPPVRDTLEVLSRMYTSVLFPFEANSKSGASGIHSEPSSAVNLQDGPEKLHGLSREQHHQPEEGASGFTMDLAENSLLALVRTGMENDFETVVFPEYPLLRDIKRHLMGSSLVECAAYAALSGSGSALFGLYRTDADAQAAQQRLQMHGVQALVTKTMPRSLYWDQMFAE